jgi:hypothetical protein
MSTIEINTAKKTLSPEHLAKMKAGREAAKVKKAQFAAENSAEIEVFMSILKEGVAIAELMSQHLTKAMKNPLSPASTEHIQTAKTLVARFGGIPDHGLSICVAHAQSDTVHHDPVVHAPRAQPLPQQAEPLPQAEPQPEPLAQAKKKRGPKKVADMTAEEKAVHDAKVAERKAKKAAPATAVEPEPEPEPVTTPPVKKPEHQEDAETPVKPNAGEKPKRVLSPEHLAKMKAGREAKKAAAAAAAALDAEPLAMGGTKLKSA